MDRYGNLVSVLTGDTNQERLVNKIQEMRRELRHLESAMASFERQARFGASPDAMRPAASLMFDWTVSMMESFCQISGLAFGLPMREAVVKDLRNKLRMFGF